MTELSLFQFSLTFLNFFQTLPNFELLQLKRLEAQYSIVPIKEEVHILLEYISQTYQIISHHSSSQAHKDSNLERL